MGCGPISKINPPATKGNSGNQGLDLLYLSFSKVKRKSEIIFRIKLQQLRLEIYVKQELRYRERTTTIHLPTLEDNEKGDIITIFKFIYGFDDVIIEESYKTGKKFSI